MRDTSNDGSVVGRTPIGLNESSAGVLVGVSVGAAGVVVTGMGEMLAGGVFASAVMNVGVASSVGAVVSVVNSAVSSSGARVRVGVPVGGRGVLVSVGSGVSVGGHVAVRVDVGVLVGPRVGNDVGDGNAVSVAVGMGVSVGRGVKLGVHVAVCVEEGEMLAVTVTVDVVVTVGDGVTVKVGVSDASSCAINVGLGVSVGVRVAVTWRLGVIDGVREGAIVGVTCGTLRLHAASNRTSTTVNTSRRTSTLHSSMQTVCIIEWARMTGIYGSKMVALR